MQPESRSSQTLNFLTLAYPKDLFVSSGAPAPYPGRAQGAQLLALAAWKLKLDESFDVESITQAGSLDVLVDQSNQVVYYGMQVDKAYFDFVRDNKYYIPEVLKTAPDEQNFPTRGTGTLEIKTAWRLAEMDGEVFIPNASQRYLTTQAMIPAVKIDNGKIVPDSSNMKQATMALIGVHVVGTIPNHPEFIWATFEHEDNSPDCASTPQPKNNPLTGQPWSLYTEETDCSNPFTSKCNIGHEGKPVTEIKPTPVCRMNPWGDSDPQSQNVKNIKDINSSVHAKLPKGREILQRYFLVGGVWTTGDLPATQSNLRGSLQLANTTMESFTQAMQCFSCHNPKRNSGEEGIKQKNLSLSHPLLDSVKRPYRP